VWQRKITRQVERMLKGDKTDENIATLLASDTEFSTLTLGTMLRFARAANLPLQSEILVSEASSVAIFSSVLSPFSIRSTWRVILRCHTAASAFASVSLYHRLRLRPPFARDGHRCASLGPHLMGVYVPVLPSLNVETVDELVGTRAASGICASIRGLTISANSPLK